jgi:CDP-diacylglycerol--inositol 3-phosphatidyltransferase
MVTDRCTTACLLCYLCSAYPAYTVYFQTIISVDLASHYMHMYRYYSPAMKRLINNSTLNQGVSSHKKIPKEQSWILRQYYGNNIVLFLFCACNELFFVSIYLLSFPPPPNSPPRLGIVPPVTTADVQQVTSAAFHFHILIYWPSSRFQFVRSRIGLMSFRW